jgi:multidrug resistance efflux pump
VVKSGQVLVTLDDSAWQDYLETLKNNLTSAQINQTAKERAVTAAQRNVDDKQSALTQAQRQVIDKQSALNQAQLNLQIAQYNLSQIGDVKSAQNAVDSAQEQVNLAMATLQNAINAADPNTDLDLLRLGVANAQKELAAAKNNLAAILAGSSIKITYDVATDVQTKVVAVSQAQNAIADAQAAIDDAKTAVVAAQHALDDANNAVGDATTNLDFAKIGVSDAQRTLDQNSALSTQIVAPFDGFITTVNATGGLAVNKGFVACQIADPNKFECTVMVNELDIPKVNLDGDATVSVDSLGGISFPAKVTHIAPTATIQQGVVNYKVLVELTSLTPVAASQQNAVQGSSTRQTQGQSSKGATSGQTPVLRAGNAAQQATPSTSSNQNVQLRDGLTVTVNIVVSKKENVLLVPNGAISTQGKQSYVQVMSAGGKIENRPITTGISNFQYTEVTQGLSEGEQIDISRTVAASTSTSTTQQRSSQPVFIPGVGR